MHCACAFLLLSVPVPALVPDVAEAAVPVAGTLKEVPEAPAEEGAEAAINDSGFVCDPYLKIFAMIDLLRRFVKQQKINKKQKINKTKNKK
jgi:hypothetical protein